MHEDIIWHVTTQNDIWQVSSRIHSWAQRNGDLTRKLSKLVSLYIQNDHCLLHKKLSINVVVLRQKRYTCEIFTWCSGKLINVMKFLTLIFYDCILKIIWNDEYWICRTLLACFVWEMRFVWYAKYHTYDITVHIKFLNI